MHKSVIPIQPSAELLAQLRVEWHPNSAKPRRWDETPLLIVQLAEALAEALNLDLDVIETQVEVVTPVVTTEVTTETFVGVVSQLTQQSLVTAEEQAAIDLLSGEP